MLEISAVKVAHVIVRAREFDAQTDRWQDSMMSGFRQDDAESTLEDFSGDSTRSELAKCIGGLNDDEQASLVALARLGRGSIAPEELRGAIDSAKLEAPISVEDYLIGIPLLADYLEEGLGKLGFSVEDAERAG